MMYIRWMLDAAAANVMYNKRWPTPSADRACTDARTALDVMYHMAQNPHEVPNAEQFFQGVKLRFVDALAKWDREQRPVCPF